MRIESVPRRGVHIMLAALFLAAAATHVDAQRVVGSRSPGQGASSAGPSTGRGSLDTSGADGLVHLDFDTEDDFATPLVNGQAIASPPRFGRLVSIHGFGPHTYGAAIFDSTPDGPNAGSSDPDLLVDRGNVVILQETAGQSTPGIYDSPDDDRFGGHVEVSFAGREVEPLRVTLVDQCPGSGPPTQVTLIDSAGRERTFVVPTGWTEDVSVHGAPGYRVLDLTSLEDQPGFLSTAFVIDDPFFDATAVTRLEIDFHGSGAFDDLVYDPYP